jgi:dolichol-phosphate mannosyltransferase
MIYASLFLAVAALLAMTVITVLRLAYGPEFFGGQATTIVLTLFIGAFQLFFLFILGQYVSRIYDETRDRPLYIVAQRVGFDRSVKPLTRHSNRLTAPVIPRSDADATDDAQAASGGEAT